MNFEILHFLWEKILDNLLLSAGISTLLGITGTLGIIYRVISGSTVSERILDALTTFFHALAMQWKVSRRTFIILLVSFPFFGWIPACLCLLPRFVLKKIRVIE